MSPGDFAVPRDRNDHRASYWRVIVLNVDNPMIEERYGPLAAAVRTYQEGRLAQALRFTGQVH
jgi:hypothetical protein